MKNRVSSFFSHNPPFRGAALLEVLAAATLCTILIGALSGLSLTGNRSGVVDETISECGAARLAEAISSDLAGLTKSDGSHDAGAAESVKIGENTLEVSTRSYHCSTNPAIGGRSASQLENSPIPGDANLFPGTPVLRRYQFDKLRHFVRVTTAICTPMSEGENDEDSRSMANSSIEREVDFHDIAGFELSRQKDWITVFIKTAHSTRMVRALGLVEGRVAPTEESWSETL